MLNPESWSPDLVTQVLQRGPFTNLLIAFVFSLLSFLLDL